MTLLCWTSRGPGTPVLQAGPGLSQRQAVAQPGVHMQLLGPCPQPLSLCGLHGQVPREASGSQAGQLCPRRVHTAQGLRQQKLGHKSPTHSV